MTSRGYIPKYAKVLERLPMTVDEYRRRSEFLSRRMLEKKGLIEFKGNHVYRKGEAPEAVDLALISSAEFWQAFGEERLLAERRKNKNFHHERWLNMETYVRHLEGRVRELEGKTDGEPGADAEARRTGEAGLQGVGAAGGAQG